MSTVTQRVKDILIDKLCLDEDFKFDNSTDLHEDLGMDSLDAVECLMEIECEFQLNIPDDAIEKVHTFGDIVNLIISMRGYE